MIAAIFRKDFEDILRTHTIWLILLGPVLMAFLMGRATRESDFRRPVIAVLSSPESGLLRVLNASENLIVKIAPSEEEAQKWLTARQACLFLKIPPGFDEAIIANEFPLLYQTYDASRPTQVALARESIRSCLRDQSGQQFPADIRSQRAAQSSGGLGLGVWLVFAIMSSLTISASSMVEEKEAGTLQQILVSPVPFFLVLMGKVTVGATLAVLSTALVLALNPPLSTVSWISLMLLIVTGAVVFSAVGTLIGLLAEGGTAASAWSGLLFLGFFLPCTLVEVSQTMSRLAIWSPAYHLYDGIQRVLLGGATLTQLWPALAALGATMAGVLVAGRWAIKTRRE